MPFAISRSIEKETFISICNAGIELSKIALAPFGFPNDLGLVYNSNEEADIEDLKNSFQQWEEVFSRHIFTSYGISDDQVAASFHKYVEVERDAKIIALMQSAASCCAVAVNPPSVVDMTVSISAVIQHATISSTATSAVRSNLSQVLIKDSSKSILNIADVHADDIHSFNICQPEIAALLLHRVLQALLTLSKGLESNVNDTNSDQDDVVDFTGIDMHIKKQLNVSIPIRPFPIQETFKYLDNAVADNKKDTLGNSSSSATSSARIACLKASLDMLKEAFTIPLTRVPCVDSGSSSSGSSNDTSKLAHLSPHLDHKYILRDLQSHSSSSSSSNGNNNNNSNSIGEINQVANHEYEVKVSVDQYHTLLQLFSQSSQMYDTLHSFGLVIKNKKATSFDPIALLQLGIIPSSLSPSSYDNHNHDDDDGGGGGGGDDGGKDTHMSLKRLIQSLCSDPTARYILQLQHKLQVLSSSIKQGKGKKNDEMKDNSDNDDDDIDDGSSEVENEIDQIAMNVTQKALTAAVRAVELHRQAKETVTQTGEVEEAIHILTHALTTPHKPYDDEKEKEDDDEEEEEDEDDENVTSTLLDAHLKCQLLIDRATFFYATLEEIEAVWITTAQQQAISVTDLPTLQYDQQEQVFTILSMIVSDCIEIMDHIDNHCAKAYALLAKQEMFLAKYMKVLKLELDEANEYRFWDKESHQHQPLLYGDVDEIKMKVNTVTSENELMIDDMKTYLLQQAVRHSLSAFLLSGCVDAEHAAVSEEAARECCRVRAKQEYHQRIVSKVAASTAAAVGIDNNPTQSELESKSDHQSAEQQQQQQQHSQQQEISKQIVPKEWLVKAFFIGHDLLSTAYSIDIFHCLVADLEIDHHHHHHHHDGENSDNHHHHHDIHNESIDSAAVSQSNSDCTHIFPLIQPPSFLLDTIAITSDDNNSQASNNHENTDAEVSGELDGSSSSNSSSSSSSSSSNNNSKDDIDKSKKSNKRKYVRDGDRGAYSLLKALIAVFDSMRLGNSNSANSNNNNSINNSGNDDSVIGMNDINIALETMSVTDSSHNNNNNNDDDDDERLFLISSNVRILNPSTQFNRCTDEETMLAFCDSKSIYSSSSSSNISNMKQHAYLVDFGELVDSAIITAQMKSKVTDIDDVSNPTGSVTRAARVRQFENDQEAEELMKVTDELARLQMNSKKKRNHRFQGINNAATAVAGMRGETNNGNATASVANNVIPSQQQQIEAPNSQAYVSALALLSSPHAQRLTGVTLTSGGKISFIEPMMSLQKLKKHPDDDNKKDDDDEDGWEDVDDDEEEEEEEASKEDEEKDLQDNDDSSSSSSLLVPIESIATRHVSYALQARLLNVLSSVCYLAGNAVDAIECLRASRIASSNAVALHDDIVLPVVTSNGLAVESLFSKNSSDSNISSNDSSNDSNNSSNDNKSCSHFISTSSIQEEEIQHQEDVLQVDTTVKLASLLTDMDETDEAELLLYSVKSKDNKNAYALIHLAELEMQKNQFETAVELLSDAKFIARQQFVAVIDIRRMQTQQAELDTSSSSSSSTYLLDERRIQNHSSLSSNHSTVYQYLHTIIKQKIDIKKDFFQWKKEIKDQFLVHLNESITSSIYSLLSATLFRLSPTQPGIPLAQIKDGLEHHPSAPYMLLCLGEIHSQTGDAVAALAAFKKAYDIDCYNPLPYLNAARVYQQIKQLKEAFHHMQLAIQVDPDLAMTKVDLAQQYLHSGNTEMALKTLDSALLLARHVSEIRDVLTARTVALMQVQLQKEGLWNANIINNVV